MATAVESAKCEGAFPDQSNISPDLEQKIIKQVEFYFGDVNLLRDTFLLNEIKKENGWVEIDVLLKFNRLKQLTTCRDVVLKAIEKSKSGLLEIDATAYKVRRSESRPLPTSTDGSRGVAILNPQTVYVKGFPADATLDDAIQYFESVGFPADGIYLRKNKKTGEFKGSVFATMPSREVAQKFVAEAPKTHEGTDMIILLKEDYHVKKAQERVQMRQEQKKRQDQIYEDKKKKAVEDQLQKIKNEMTPGAVLVVSNLPEGINEKTLRAYWGKFARLAWVDLSADKKSGHIRFEEADSAKQAWEAARAAHPASDDANAVMMDNQPVTFVKVLEGEEEETFWKGVWAQLAERRASYNQNRRGGGRGGRGGRGRGRGGYRGNKRGHDDEEGADKRSKKEIHIEDSDTSDDGGEN